MDGNAETLDRLYIIDEPATRESVIKDVFPDVLDCIFKTDCLLYIPYKGFAVGRHNGHDFHVAFLKGFQILNKACLEKVVLLAKSQGCKTVSAFPKNEFVKRLHIRAGFDDELNFMGNIASVLHVEKWLEKYGK